MLPEFSFYNFWNKTYPAFCSVLMPCSQTKISGNLNFKEHLTKHKITQKICILKIKNLYFAE